MCVVYVRGQMNGVRNDTDCQYLDKSERGLLVEKLENSDCPICLTENTDLILTKDVNMDVVKNVCINIY